MSQFKRDDYTTASLYLIVAGADATIQFLTRVFGATKLRRFPNDAGKAMHGQVHLGDTVVMVADSAAPDCHSVASHVHGYVEYVDATQRKALDAGATSVQAPTEKGSMVVGSGRRVAGSESARAGPDTKLAVPSAELRVRVEERRARVPALPARTGRNFRRTRGPFARNASVFAGVGCFGGRAGG